mmetsp:Transcript_7672/g.17718  ORF Transcript_7672/g.17718 Transcript_7672/m.17718 type:complete len:217 (+) Transcript_7672:1030-1680(+)
MSLSTLRNTTEALPSQSALRRSTRSFRNFNGPAPMTELVSSSQTTCPFARSCSVVKVPSDGSIISIAGAGMPGNGALSILNLTSAALDRSSCRRASSSSLCSGRTCPATSRRRTCCSPALPTASCWIWAARICLPHGQAASFSWSQEKTWAWSSPDIVAQAGRPANSRSRTASPMATLMGVAPRSSRAFTSAPASMSSREISTESAVAAACKAVVP